MIGRRPAVMTALAGYAWLRINNTFMSFLWNYCRVNAEGALKTACTTPS